MNIEIDELLMITGMAIVTFGVRYIMLPIAGRFEFSPLFERTLKFVPPTVLSAIIVPSVFMPNGDTLNISLSNPYIVGAATACAIGWIYKNLLITIISSMCTFLCYQWILKL